jgi:hypothetical protein
MFSQAIFQSDYDKVYWCTGRTCASKLSHKTESTHPPMQVTTTTTTVRRGNVNNMGTTHEAREVRETHKEQCARSTVFIKYVSMVGK